MLSSCASQDAAPRVVVAVVQSELEAALAASEHVDAIVSLRLPVDASRERTPRAAAIAALHERVLARLGDGVVASRRFRHTPAFSATITRAALTQLRADPDVRSVQLDHEGQTQLMQATKASRVDEVRAQLGLTGRGVRVAVVDTGIDVEHPDLRDAIVAQHCFSRFACPPFNTAESESAIDDLGHGTAVAGVIGSRGQVSAPGFAPEVELVAVKVQGGANGFESDWVAGLDWVFDNLPSLRVDIVNMSLGSYMIFGADRCDQAVPAMAEAVDNLVKAGVTVVATAGNQGSLTELSAPACNTGAIAVGASYDADEGPQPPDGSSFNDQFKGLVAACRDETTQLDQVICFSNRSERLDLVAPGSSVVTDWRDGATQAVWGTSVAAAATTGVAALLKECEPILQPDAVKKALRASKREAVDRGSALKYPVLDALDTMRAGCTRAANMTNAGSAATPPPPAAGGGGMGGAAGMAGERAPAPRAGAGVVPSVGANVQGSAGSTEPSPDAGVDAGVTVSAENGLSLVDVTPARGTLPSSKKSTGCAIADPGTSRAGTAWLALLGLALLRRRRVRS